MAKRRQTFYVVIAGLLIAPRAWAGTFTAGDLAVFQSGPRADSGALTSGPTPITIVELNKAANQASPVQTIAIPTSGAQTLLISGSAGSTGMLKSTNGGHALGFDAHTAAAASGSENTVLSRAGGMIDNAGNLTLTSAYAGTTGNQARGAITNDNSTFFFVDQGGLYSTSQTASLNSANIRSAQFYGGALYVLQQSSTATVKVLSSVSITGNAPTLTAAYTGLPGLPNDNTAQDFLLLASGTQGSTYDTLYLAETTGLAKYSFDGTTWTARGTAAIANGAYGLAGIADAAGGVDLYFTSSTNSALVESAIDSTAFSANINLGSSLATLYTAPANTQFRGIDFVPTAVTAVPEPASLAVLGLGIVARAGSRRRSNRR